MTSTLKALLADRMSAPPSIFVGPPDAASSTTKRLNLFLYKVRENPHLKNQDVPDPGTSRAPPLSLDLHYLVTAFGADGTDDADLNAQEVLGDAMLTLHDFPVIAPDLRKVRSPGFVIDPAIAGDFERVKVTLDPISLEDETKIWTALTAHYRLSAAYCVNVVQMQSRKPRTAALPVRERRIHVGTLRTPMIVDLARTPPLLGVPVSVAEAGDTIELRGVNLGSPSTRVRIGPRVVAAPSGADDVLQFAVPTDMPAGIHDVCVVQDVMEGATILVHDGLRSNAVAVQIVPRITQISPASGPPSTALTVDVSADILPDQDVVLLVGDRAIPSPSRTANTTTIAFPLASAASPLAAGTYVVRIRVAGAESRLSVDPITGAYAAPTFTVT